jgi:hypothetical protein
MILHLQHLRADGDVDTYHLKPGRRYHIGRGSACEVRILDLKMSRKHAALEFIDEAWRFIDLCSTNGCKLNGNQVSGTVTLPLGGAIDLGTTTLSAHRFVAPDTDPDALSAGEAAPPAVKIPTPAPAPTASRPLPQEDRDAPQSAAEIGTGALMAKPKSEPPSAAAPTPAKVETNHPVRPLVFKATSVGQPSDLVTPHQDEATLVATPRAPIPAAAQSDSARRIEPVVIRSESQPLDPPPAEIKAAGPMDVLATEERAFFITVLGKRVGPLSRAQARDLKARELKGTLTSADLATYPVA